ncbi:2TM domain-containing protein [Marixanthomonas sp. SCSIO 43207]|uniref:2TM domain-containing protein n=1 Tax=Marixanthomonas sp. SCSIO 43207 TaxID=2779360 RepID=UPI001CA93BAB|nr:2TM domain-containing protein [Marixanthomonas sp. SCSIO 43207]UAB81566.1 2TM domain-containing protein [Marixanthomonas sp. SCSIO 43207]
MFSKSKKTERIDSEQREQYEYARRRIKEKKNLMRHFIFFLAGSILLLIIDLVLKKGADLIFPNWSVWVVLIWAFILLIHVFNVFVMSKFMGKEWEDRQLEKLKAKQTNRINELEKKVHKDLQLPKDHEVKKKENNNPLPPDVQ